MLLACLSHDLWGWGYADMLGHLVSLDMSELLAVGREREKKIEIMVLFCTFLFWGYVCVRFQPRTWLFIFIFINE